MDDHKKEIWNRRSFLQASVAGAGGIGIFTDALSKRWPKSWVIWLRQRPDAAERIAAEHLRGILQQRGTNCQLIFGEDRLSNAPGQILIGVIDKFTPLRAFLKKRKFELHNMGQDGFLTVFDRAGMTVAVGSANPRGVLYGAYALGEHLAKAHFTVPVSSLAKPALEWRWISSAARDMPFYRKLITEYAPRYKFNLLHIWSVFIEDQLGISGSFKYYMAQPLWFRKYPKLYEYRKNEPVLRQAVENLKELSRLAAQRDLVLFHMLPVLHYYNVPSAGPAAKSHREFLRSVHPEFFNPEGEPDLASPQVHRFITDQIDEFFELYPDLGGLLGHTGEMATFSPSGLKHQTIPMDEAILRIMQTVYEACRKHGKMVIWDLHSAGGDTRNSDAVIKAVKTGRFPGIMLTAESTYTEQEFSLSYPTTSYLRDMVKSAPSIFTQDCYGEGWDFNFLPFIVDRYLIRHFRDCEKAGATGGGVLHYAYQGKYHAFNTLQHINLELQTRMMWEGGRLDPEQVKRHWIEKHYEKEVTPDLLKAFNRVNLILSRIFYIAENGSWGPRHGFPKFSWMLGGPFEFIEFFSTPGTLLTKDWTRRTASVRAIAMEEMRREKQEAVQQCESALEDLARVEGKMNKEKYAGLLARFIALWYYARACQIVLEVGYYFKNAFIEHYDPEAKDPVRNLEDAGPRLEGLVREARADSRLRGLEEDIYRLGLEGRFLEVAEKFSHDLAAAVKERKSVMVK